MSGVATMVGALELNSSCDGNTLNSLSREDIWLDYAFKWSLYLYVDKKLKMAQWQTLGDQSKDYYSNTDDRGWCPHQE